MGFLSKGEIAALGFKSVGGNVQISDKASFYNFSKISFGDCVRVDDFCVLSAGEGGIEIGSTVHIACQCVLMGQGKITLSDFCGLSSRVSVYSSTDDYSGGAMTNPTVPEEYRNVRSAPVLIEEHVIVGAGSVVLPGATLHRGSAIGALSLVNKSVPPYVIVSGSPLRKIGNRNSTRLEEYSRMYENEK